MNNLNPYLVAFIFTNACIVTLIYILSLPTTAFDERVRKCNAAGGLYASGVCQVIAKDVLR